MYLDQDLMGIATGMLGKPTFTSKTLLQSILMKMLPVAQLQ
jgi:hypothetical protein